MGAVAELFRTYPGTIRSAHPHRSISANGLHAATITARHDLDCPAGERSPLAQLYDLNAKILLLGVGPRKITALHLAEYRATYPGKRDVPNGGLFSLTVGVFGRPGRSLTSTTMTSPPSQTISPIATQSLPAPEPLVRRRPGCYLCLH